MTSNDPKKIAKDTTDAASAALTKGRDAASDTAAKAADQAGDAASRVSSTAQDAYERVKGTVSDLGNALPGSASDAVETGRQIYGQSSDRLAKQVARQPIEALLLAGAIGYLVGWAANRS